jgi:multiple sugar transport system permease protein
MVALLFRTVDAIRVFDTVFVQTRGALDTEPVSLVAYDTLLRSLNLGLGSAVSVLIFLLVVAVAFVFVRALGATLSGVGADAGSR